MNATRVGSAVLSTAILLGTVFFSDVVRGEDAVSPNHAAEIERHSRRLMTVIELVLDHHIEPPTRQEMLVAALRNFCETGKQSIPAGLSRRVSDLTTPQEIESLLREIWVRAKPADESFDRLSSAAIDGALSVVPGESRLVGSKELEVQEQLQANRYVGIGIALTMNKELQYPQIANVIPKGPADRAGAVSGDCIVRVNDNETANVPLSDVVDRLRGPEGTHLTIHVKGTKDKAARELKLTRSVVPRETIRGYDGEPGKKWYYRPDPAQPIALVRFNEISASTLHELRQLEPQLREEGMLAIVLDLRNVWGGNAAAQHHHALMLADGLLDGGTLGTLRTIERRQTYQADRECAFRGWPMAVLVGEGTSGAAEWLAAALQQNRRAVIIGRQTAGQGYVTTSIPVQGEESLLALATGIVERPDGTRFSSPPQIGAQRVRIGFGNDRRGTGGVRPNRELPLVTGSVTPRVVTTEEIVRARQQLGSAWETAVEFLQPQLPRSAKSASKDKEASHD